MPSICRLKFLVQLSESFNSDVITYVHRSFYINYGYSMPGHFMIPLILIIILRIIG